MKKQIKSELQYVSNEQESESASSQSDSEFVITEISESEKHKSKSIWSLKGLSSQIKSLVNELQSTTYKQLATILIERLSNELQQIHGTERRKEIQNLKRRVYDAINVMVAMGVLSKEKKIISFHKSDRGMLLKERQNIENTKQAILAKRKQLTDGTVTFLLLKDLIKRNQQSKSENEILQMPVIGVSVPLQGNDFQMCQKSGRKLLLKSKKPIHIYSELDILHKIID